MPALPESLRLEGDGVVLRDWRDEDAPALAPVCGDWDVCAFTSVPWSYSEAEARAWIERQREKHGAGAVLTLAIEGPEERVVGNVNLARIADSGREAAIGYWLVPAARGQGLAGAAVALLIDRSFDSLDLERIEFAILPQNHASRRLAERVGARPEGIRKRSHQADGRWWDMTIWSVSR